MAPPGRAARIYRGASLLLLNTLAALLVINLLLAAGFGIADRARRPAPGALRFGDEALDRAYPGMSRQERDSMLAEVWGRRLEFEPWTMFREPASRGRYVNVGAAGFRLVPDQGPWPIERDRFNVFVFGGSTTFGYGVADDQTIAAHLQELLRRDGGLDRPATVYNFGRGYYYSTPERLLFERLLTAGHVPDLAIFVDGLNDFYYAEAELENADAFRAALEPPKKPRTGELMVALAGRTPLGRLARMLAAREGRPRAETTSAAGVGASNAAPAREMIAAVVERYLGNQKLIAAAASAYGVRAAFVWQPVPTYRYDLKRHAFAAAGFERHALSGPGYAWFDSALASGAVAADPNFIWCADVAARDTGVCYVDRVHYSGRMCRRLADEIVRQMSARGLLARQ